MAKKKNEVTLDSIDAESIIHSFRTTDHLQMVKDAKEGKDIQLALQPEIPSIENTEPIASSQKAGDNPESLKEENRRRRGKSQDYESLFIREAGGITAREGKTVYIRKQYHDRILKSCGSSAVMISPCLAIWTTFWNIILPCFRRRLPRWTTRKMKGYFST